MTEKNIYINRSLIHQTIKNKRSNVEAVLKWTHFNDFAYLKSWDIKVFWIKNFNSIHEFLLVLKPNSKYDVEILKIYKMDNLNSKKLIEF